MKQITMLVMGLALTTAASAQIDFSSVKLDLAGNYTMYKSDFQQKTPGAKFRVALPVTEKSDLGLSFTYHAPIKAESTAMFVGGGSAPSEIRFNFKTISLDANYFIGEQKDQGANLYLDLGMSLVLVNYEEKVKGGVPPGETTTNMIEKTKENGFTIDLGAGGEYAMGKFRLFGEAAVALPANQVNDSYVTNVIPLHFVFNAGIRFTLGNSDNYY